MDMPVRGPQSREVVCGGVGDRCVALKGREERRLDTACLQMRRQALGICLMTSGMVNLTGGWEASAVKQC